MNDPSLTFDEHDKLSLREFATDLENFLRSERDFVEGSLVVSLNAPFGAGKSTFLTMWRNDMIARRQKSDMSVPLPVMLNAWEGDHAGDPLLAIISGLSEQLKLVPESAEFAVNIRKTVTEVVTFSLSIANQIVAGATGVDAMAAGEKATEQSTRGNPKADMLNAYEKRVAALHQLRKELEAAFDKTSAIIMVDELDRCRPDYAVEYLEAIKHLFLTRQVAFILAVDRHQLACSARALFGHDLRFDEYYRKFAHRNIDLPEPKLTDLTTLLSHFSQQLVVGCPARPATHSHAKGENSTAENYVGLIAGLKLSLRQIHEVFRIYGHILATTQPKGFELAWGFKAGAFLMAALSVAKSDLYHKIGKGSAIWRDIANILKQDITIPDVLEFWMTVLVVGGAGLPKCNRNNPSEVGTLLAQIDLRHLDTFASPESFAQRIAWGASSAWGMHGSASNPFERIYEMIERLKRFSP